MRRRSAILSALAILLLTAQPSTADPQSNRGSKTASTERVTKLRLAVADPGRTPANIARDRYRHPVETLDFFEVDPGDTIVEIWPGGGWYTEILAPFSRRTAASCIWRLLTGAALGPTSCGPPMRPSMAHSRLPTSLRLAARPRSFRTVPPMW